MVDAKAGIEGTAAYFQPLHAKLADLINPANYPNFQADVSRVRSLSQSYRNVEGLFSQNRKDAATAFQQSEASLAEVQRIAGVYTRLIEQDTDMGRSIKGGATDFLQKRKAFLDAAAAAVKSLPGEIRADAIEVKQVADEAVANQKPMWFTGGIPQQLGWIDEKLELLTALDSEGSVTVAAEVKALKEGLAAQADSLKALIIRDNQLPGDNYAGADRDALIALAKETWKKEEPDFELLAVHIPSDTWKRNTRWTHSGSSWYFVDSSSIQVRLFVADKENPEQAISRPINIAKDHTQGDKLFGGVFRTIEEKLQPHEYYLRSKFR